MAERDSIEGEDAAIARLLAMTDPANGDDAAAVRVGGGALCVSTDSTVEGVHAPLGAPVHDLGRRAAARALSDLAAMGAAPAGMVCAVHVPSGRWDDAIEAMAGATERAAEQGCAVLGGDVTRVESAALAFVVTVLGRRAGTRRLPFVRRDGARPGDVLLVTGALGATTAALDAGAARLPEPPDRIRAGIALAPWVHAMIDLSDGLARDAALLAAASGVDVSLDLDALPLAPGAADPVRAAAGGDDYELLIAIDPARVDTARAALAVASPDVALTRIGDAAAGTGSMTARRAGAPVALPGGFRHQ